MTCTPLLLAALALALASCAAPPRPGDPSIEVSPVRAEHFSAPALRIHVLSVNGARVPPKALDRAIETIRKHVGLPVETHDHGAVDIPEDEHGNLTAPLVWPVPPPGSGQSSGIRGTVTQGEPGAERSFPIVEPGVVLVAAVPGARDGSGVTGYATVVATGDGRTFRTGLVVGRERAIRARANLFVNDVKLWQWTITHEIGHVLGVPAHNSHVWPVPGLGPHCTHPECVMYTGVDWRVVTTGLLKGWPMDFCELCAEELAAARQAVGCKEPSPLP